MTNDKFMKGTIVSSNPVDLHVVRFCARECELQISGEMSVGWMVHAWTYAQKRWNWNHPLTIADILEIASRIEPIKNFAGFRRQPVFVGWSEMPDYKLVPSMMVNLVEAKDDLTPAEFTHEFLKIHPFVDGNGRTAQVVYNWLNNTLDAPVWSPNYFGDTRRVSGS